MNTPLLHTLTYYGDLDRLLHPQRKTMYYIIDSKTDKVITTSPTLEGAESIQAYLLSQDRLCWVKKDQPPGSCI